MSDVFISYSRTDSDFVSELQRSLEKAGRSPWIDLQGIRPAEDFMKAICDAIDRAQAFVFVLSPDSLASRICARELEHAVQGHKRLVPVVCREVQESIVPEPLRRLHWIRMTESVGHRRLALKELFAPKPFDLLVRQLMEAVDTDLPWIRAHTRLLWMATEWDLGGRSEDQLLRGQDLASVMAMMAGELRQPRPNRLQLSFIEASQDAEKLARRPQREELARLAGEVNSVQQMQAGGLPRTESVFPGEKRFALFASREQAQEVGGDFYDFYRLDQDRIFLVVGDVAGKGLPAGFFVQVVKALVKSAALRSPRRLDELVREVNSEISRENPSMLFVSAFIAILDANTGQLTTCCAGCESPLLILGQGERTAKDLDGADGPPLCVIDDYDYPTATWQLAPGDTLCAFTDGVIEAVNAEGRLLGREGLKTLLGSPQSSEELNRAGERVLKALQTFGSGVQAADDRTFLFLRWNHSAITDSA